MLHHVCGVTYDENMCGPITTRKCRSTNSLINYTKCNEHETTNFSQSGAKVKDICRQVERFKNNNEGSKVENIVIHVGTNHIQSESPRDSSRKI